jgi:WD40 repeat protein
VAFSADGGRLVSGGDDGSVRVWDATGGDELLVLHALDGGEHAALAGGRVTSCSAGAWRWLGWLAPSPVTGALTR